MVIKASLPHTSNAELIFCSYRSCLSLYCRLRKVDKRQLNNYRLWRAQVLPTIRATQLEGFIDGSDRAPEKTLEVEKDSKKVVVPNPEYVTWRVRDQYVLTYLVTSLLREVLAGIAARLLPICGRPSPRLSPPS
jgi:hypothetical protein